MLRRENKQFNLINYPKSNLKEQKLILFQQQ